MQQQREHGSWQRFMQPARNGNAASSENWEWTTDKRANENGNQNEHFMLYALGWHSFFFFFWFVRKTSAFAAVAPAAADVVFVVPVRFVVVSPCCCFCCGALNAENHVA